MRTLAALALLILAGCAGGPNREAILKGISPAPMSQGEWAQVRGTYTGGIRSTTQRFGFEGESSIEIRLDLSGWADQPGVVARMVNGYSTAFTLYGEHKGTYTNVPAQRYGSQGSIEASTHAPNILLLRFVRNGARNGTWMIMTMRGNGVIDVDLVGHSGWRGEGELLRIPYYQRHL